MLNNEFPPLGGGTASVNHTILEHFAQDPKFEIDLITSNSEKKHLIQDFTPNIKIFKLGVGSKCLHHATNYELISYAVKALPLAIKLQREKKYDLCMAWSTVPAGAVALTLRHLTKLPYIVRVCGPDIPGFETRYNWIYPFLTPILRQAWRKAKTVVAKCQSEAELVRRCFPEASLTIIPNGVDTERFQPPINKQLSPSLKLLCVGRLIERKGQRLLFKALHLLKKEGVYIQLDLVGGGDEEEIYRNEVNELGIQTQVNFLGIVPRNDMPRIYQNADVFVLPSFNEGMSVAALEAMASGLPLLVTANAGSDELVEIGKNGFTFPRGDVAALALHIKRLSVDKPLLSTLATNSRQKALMFSWSNVVKQYKALISS